MRKVKVGGLQLWEFDSLSTIPAVRHFVTDRRSNAKGGEFTLSFSSSPDRQVIVRNRTMLAQALGVAPANLFLPSQVHKTNILHVTSSTTHAALLETDALIANEKGVCIAVMSADCVPILLYDPYHHAAAAVHAGWRGTVAHILEKTLHRMRDTFGTEARHVMAAIGPSVCQASYEVGSEVIDEVNRAFGAENGLMIAQPGGKALLNLWEANRRQLLNFGVPEKNIEISGLCSVQQNEFFFSARKGDAGRYAAGIALM